MSDTWQDVFRRIHDARSTDEYCTALQDGARDLGFEFFAFGFRMPFPLMAPEFRIVSNYPTAWQQRYQYSGYVSLDPTVKHGLRSLAPLVWSEGLDSETAKFWEDAWEYGLRYGCAQPSRGPGGMTGMLTLARSGSPITADELAEKLPILTLMSRLAHEWFTKSVSSPSPQISRSVRGGTREYARSFEKGLAPLRPGLPSCAHERRHDPMENAKVLTAAPRDLVPQLTAREVEVLRWTAEGKISMDIAAILGITERTVNFHVGNCMRKIGATSKTSAAVQAALWGLL